MTLIITNTDHTNSIPLKNGINSFRVRSGPNARAMVLNLLIEFKRNWISSFFSSSIKMAMGYNSSPSGVAAKYLITCHNNTSRIKEDGKDEEDIDKDALPIMCCVAARAYQRSHPKKKTWWYDASQNMHERESLRS
jgi:hypothetical protein